jgi:hypothetical protein
MGKDSVSEEGQKGFRKRVTTVYRDLPSRLLSMAPCAGNADLEKKRADRLFTLTGAAMGKGEIKSLER